MILLTKNLSELVFKKHKSFATVSAIANVAYAMAMAVPISLSVATADNIQTDASSAQLAFSQEQNVVSLADVHNTITPGESKIQRETREASEKAEAEARAKAAVVASASKPVVTYTAKVYSDPSNFDSIYQRAQAAYGVDWRLLKAVHYVETGGSGSTSKKSYAGAQGPMQFLPSTWRAYGVDGNGDGIADINNVEDAIFAAAKYLSACGYPNVKAALWGYNPSSAYYNKVMDVARSLGFNG